jgi:hypothetical protein
LPAVVTRSVLRIENATPQRIKSFYLVASIFVAPVSIWIKSIKVIIFAFIYNKSNLAGTNRAFVVKGGFQQIGDICFHKPLHNATVSSLGCVKGIAVAV